MRKWMVELREARGLTREKMARLSDVSVDLICYVEGGSETLPPLAIQIADAYRMSDKQLMEISRDFTYRSGSEGESPITFKLDLSKRKYKPQSDACDAAQPATSVSASKSNSSAHLLQEQRTLNNRGYDEWNNKVCADAAQERLSARCAAEGLPPMRYLLSTTPPRYKPYLDIAGTDKMRIALGMSAVRLGEAMGGAKRYLGLKSKAKCGGSLTWIGVERLCHALSCKPWDVLKTKEDDEG